MLSRASLPLLRLQAQHVASRNVLASTQVRYLRQKGYFLGRDKDYKIPSNAHQTAPFASQTSKDPSDQVPSTGAPEPEDSRRRAHDPQEIRDRFGISRESQTKAPEEQDLSSFESFAEPQRPRRSPEPSQPPRPPPEPPRTSPQEPLQEPVEAETEPQQPLPDLTRGIPSTLDAELNQTVLRERASKASLNITEDPKEEGGSPPDEGPKDRRPNEYVSSSDRKKSMAAYYFYISLAAGTIFYSVYLGRNWDSEEEERKHPEAPSGWAMGLFYARVRARLGSTMSYYNDPVTAKLLPDEEADPGLRMPFTLVLSLEDLLIHSEWTRSSGWRIAKRPGLDYFLRYLSQYYELVLFTSQPSATADQVLRKLDPYMMIRWPLFREATLYKDGGYIKDLSYLNRDLKKVIIVDTDGHHVKNQPENAIVLPKWNGDPKDQTLIQMIPFLEYVATMGFEDSRTVLKSFEGKYVPVEFARREKLLREKFEAQQAEKNKGRKPKKSSSFGLGSLFKQQSPDGMPSSEDAMAEGKMLWDVIRERGQRTYLELEKKIKDEGEKWLKEREEEEKRMQEEAMKNMARGGFLPGWLSGGDQKK